MKRKTVAGELLENPSQNKISLKCGDSSLVLQNFFPPINTNVLVKEVNNAKVEIKIHSIKSVQALYLAQHRAQ